MKATLLKGLVLSASLFCANAYAAFDGDYDVSNWTATLGTGSIDLSGAPLGVSLTSGNDGSGDLSSTIFSVAITAAGTLSFDWSYSSNEGNAFWDPFGYELNGSVTRLTTNGGGPSGGPNQSGSVSIAVAAGDIFGFRQTTRDNQFGSASTGISNFSAPSLTPAPVPVPPSFGLFGFALGGLVMMQRREKAHLSRKGRRTKRR